MGGGDAISIQAQGREDDRGGTEEGGETVKPGLVRVAVGCGALLGRCGAILKSLKAFSSYFFGLAFLIGFPIETQPVQP